MTDGGEETMMAGAAARQSAVAVTPPRHHGRFGLHSVRLQFRRWRRSRAFWGGVWSILGGLIILVMPAMSIRLLIASGTTVLVGIINGLLIVIFGLFLWFAPTLRQIAGVLIVLLAVAALITADLGGFLVGMLLAMVGGALGFSWVPAEPRLKKWRTRRLLHLPVPAVQPDLEVRGLSAWSPRNLEAEAAPVGVGVEIPAPTPPASLVTAGPVSAEVASVAPEAPSAEAVPPVEPETSSGEGAPLASASSSAAETASGAEAIAADEASAPAAGGAMPAEVAEAEVAGHEGAPPPARSTTDEAAAEAPGTNRDDGGIPAES